MKFILVILIFLNFKTALGQTITLDISKITSLEVKELYCFDSTGQKQIYCSLDLDWFTVKFEEIIWDKSSNKLTLKGELDPIFPNVGLYLSDSNKIDLDKPICYTSYDPSNMMNDGHFQISLILKDNLSLYFYDRYHFARQYQLYKFEGFNR